MNEHIRNYLKSFIETDDNPHYALFLKGSWGTGKTYFVNKLLEEYTDDTKVKQHEIIKISLFGVKTFEDIDLKIYQEIHPVLSSNGMKVVGAVARTALRFGTNIDFNKDGKSDLNMTLGGFSLKKQTKVKKIQKKLLVVDDLERALMTTYEIFGYFSEIVTESDTKVIFIGNEEKISEDTKSEYLQIKEKIIGMEFKIEPDSNAAIDQFLIEIPFSEKEEIRSIIADLSTKLECNNLRIIRQALFNLDLFIKSIESIESFDDSDKQKCITIFLMLFIQKSLKYIVEEQRIEEVISIFFRTGLSYSKYSKKEGKDEDYMFSTYKLTGYTPLIKCWHKIIFNGNYQKDFLKKEYENEQNQIKQSQTEKKLLFKLIGDWRCMDKDSFSETIKKLNEEIETGVYLHLGEILHYVNIMIVFSKWRLVPESIDNIQSRVLKFMSDYKDKIIPEKDWTMMQIDYAGYEYSFDVPEFKEFYDKVKEFNRTIAIEASRTNINADIALLETDISLFCENIRHVNGNGKYRGQPIMYYLDIDKFYEKLCSISIEDQMVIEESFEERYGIPYSNGKLMKEYYDDYENLKKLAEKYKSDDVDFSYDPKAFFRHTLIGKWFELIRFFENKCPDLTN